MASTAGEERCDSFKRDDPAGLLPLAGYVRGDPGETDSPDQAVHQYQAVRGCRSRLAGEERCDEAGRGPRMTAVHREGIRSS